MNKLSSALKIDVPIGVSHLVLGSKPIERTARIARLCAQRANDKPYERKCIVITPNETSKVKFVKQVNRFVIKKNQSAIIVYSYDEWLRFLTKRLAIECELADDSTLRKFASEALRITKSDYEPSQIIEMLAKGESKVSASSILENLLDASCLSLKKDMTLLVFEVLQNVSLNIQECNLFVDGAEHLSNGSLDLFDFYCKSSGIFFYASYDDNWGELNRVQLHKRFDTLEYMSSPSNRLQVKMEKIINKMPVSSGDEMLVDLLISEDRKDSFEIISEIVNEKLPLSVLSSSQQFLHSLELTLSKHKKRYNCSYKESIVQTSGCMFIAHSLWWISSEEDRELERLMRFCNLDYGLWRRKLKSSSKDMNLMRLIVSNQINEILDDKEFELFHEFVSNCCFWIEQRTVNNLIDSVCDSACILTQSSYPLSISILKNHFYNAEDINCILDEIEFMTTCVNQSHGSVDTVLHLSNGQPIESINEQCILCGLEESDAFLSIERLTYQISHLNHKQTIFLVEKGKKKSIELVSVIGAYNL